MNADTSAITNMSTLFVNGGSGSFATFNLDISGWDTSSVTSMYQMFYGAAAFDQNISDWNTSSVTDMTQTFSGATAFSQDLSSWDVANVTLNTDFSLNAGGVTEPTWPVITITHNGITYGTVISPATGRTWLDRNLGASQVCDINRADFSDDASYVTSQESCFGDYYQWGRITDGHEKITNADTASRLSALPATGATGGSFVQIAGDWLTAGVDDIGALRTALWSKTDGTSICPIGYRVPTSAELQNDTLNAEVSLLHH
ncbi:MAG: BspA family leucine-rich repeat surface protein [Sulfurimonas sp.]|nr:BspA family leucine-rich repeat surface protein [Sulfurimonas sp.]